MKKTGLGILLCATLAACPETPNVVIGGLGEAPTINGKISIYSLGVGTIEAELFPTGAIGSSILQIGSINSNGEFTLKLPDNTTMPAYAVNDLGSGSSAGTNYFFSNNAPSDNVNCPDGETGSLQLTSGMKIGVVFVHIKVGENTEKLTQFNGSSLAVTRLWASKAGKMIGSCSNFGTQVTYNLILAAGWNNVEVVIDSTKNTRTYTSKAPSAELPWRLGASLETF
jgi:hypothetical protein